MDEDFEIIVKNISKVQLDIETFCPYKSIDIQCKVYYPAQYDGHPWTEENVIAETKHLTYLIVNSFEEKIEIVVNEINPYKGLCKEIK